MKFSEFYLPPKNLLKDSERARKRIGTHLHSISFKLNNYFLGRKIKSHIGVDIPMYQSLSGDYQFDFETFINTVSIIDFLDLMTIVYLTIEETQQKKDWKLFVKNCFQEEGMAYSVDDECCMRYTPDLEFEMSRDHTLAGLQDEEFRTVRKAFNLAFDDFQKNPKKNKSAIRHIFEAIEILFKKITRPKYNFDQPNETNIEKSKQYILDKIAYQIDDTEKKSLPKVFESFKNWTNSMHPYRHGQNTDDYDNPSDNLTILALSQGAAYLRFLISISYKA